MNIHWKYQSNGTLTILYNGIEKIFTKIGLFDIKETIDNHLHSIGASDLVKDQPRTESKPNDRKPNNANTPKHQGNTKKVIKVGLSLTGNSPPPRTLRKNRNRK